MPGSKVVARPPIQKEVLSPIRTPVKSWRCVCSIIRLCHSHNPHPACMATRKLSLVTWNVWFDAFESSKRFAFIFHLMETYQPDLLLFQEVTPNFMQLLQKQRWIDAYDCSDDFSCKTVDPYGVLTIAKKSLDCKFQFIPMPSNMERQLLICRTTGLGLNLVVGNVHLESLANSVLREKQLQMCAETFIEDSNWILCGDFNFCSYKNFAGNGPLENSCLQRQLPGYCDMWTVLHPNEKGTVIFV